jgi:hypothetical protein
MFPISQNGQAPVGDVDTVEQIEPAVRSRAPERHHLRSTEARATVDRIRSQSGSELRLGAAAAQTRSLVGHATDDMDTQLRLRGYDDGQYGVPWLGGPEAVLRYLAL